MDQNTHRSPPLDTRQKNRALRPSIHTLAACLLAAWLLPGVRPAAALEVIPGRFSVNGFFDTIIGYNMYNSGTVGLEVDHWVTMVNWRISPRVRFFGDLTLEHGLHHDDHGQFGEIRTRTFVQFQHSDAFKAAAGSFLTPFGHYNQVRDASITYVTTDLSDAVYDEHQIGWDALGNPVHDTLNTSEGAGVWLSGHARPGDRWGMHWDLYAINGQARAGSNTSRTDDNANKGIGTRALFDLPAGLHLGGAWYSERHGALGADPTPPTPGPPWVPAGAERRVRLVEAEWQAGPVNLLGEQIWSQVDAYPVPLATIPFTQPETHAAGQYVVASVALTDTVTPYVRYGHYLNRWFVGETWEAVSLGVSLHTSPGTVIKFQHKAIAGADDVSEAQLAVAF